MTSQETAQYLQVSVATLTRLARAGRIPATRDGRVWRFDKKQVNDWFARGGNRYD